MGRRSVNYPKTYVKSDGRKLVSSGPRDLQRVNQTSLATSPDLEGVEGLKRQLDGLRDELRRQQSSNKPEGYFTPDEVDEEIRKAVKQAIAEATLSFKRSTEQIKRGDSVDIQTYKSRVLELQKGNDDLTRLHQAITNQNTDLNNKIKRLNEELVENRELKKQIAVLEQTLTGKEELIETLKTRPAIINDQIIEDPDRPKMEEVFIDPLEKDEGKGLKSYIDIEDVTPEGADAVDGKVDKLRDLLGKKLPGGLKNE